MLANHKFARRVHGLFHNRIFVVQFVFGLCVFVILQQKKGWYIHTNTAASILTIFGVLGTFLGIYLGLQGFDIDNIEGSIPALLEGLKLAFLTSLVGIFSAIVLKVSAFTRVIKIQDPDEETISKFVTELTTALAMEELKTAIREEGEATRTVLGSIKEDLTSIYTSLNGGQSQTIAQLQRLTTTVSDQHDLLREEFQVFSENVAESVAKLATDELIEALKTVIEDFNAEITEAIR